MKLRKSIARLSLLAVAGCGGGSSIGGLNAEAVFVFALTQSQEIPVPKPTSASGTAQVVLYADKVDYDITGNSITGVTMVHIHTGAPGVAGPVYLTLLNQPSSPSGVINGVITSGSLTSTNLPSGVTLAALKTLLLSGNAYIDVHTTTNTTGEIRGQVK